MKSKRNWGSFPRPIPKRKKNRATKWLAGFILYAAAAFTAFFFLAEAVGAPKLEAEEIERPVEERQEEINPNPTKDEVKQYIALQAAITPAVKVEEAMKIAACESQYDAYAKNPKSTAKGVYQFTDPTWQWIKAEGDQFNWQENINQFFIWYQRYPSWWSECLPKQ